MKTETLLLVEFLRGSIAMGMATAGLFFLRFWRESRDRLFGYFALAFFLLAINRVLLLFVPENSDIVLAPYVVRLFAFGIILAAIVDKNIRRS